MGRFWTFAGVFRCVISLFCNKHGLNDLLFRVQIGNCIRIIVGFFVSLSSVKKKNQTLAFFEPTLFTRFIKLFKCTKNPIILWYSKHTPAILSFIIYFTYFKNLVGENQICNYFKDIKMMTFGCCLLNNKVHIPFT